MTLGAILTPAQVLERETIEFTLTTLAAEIYRLEALADTSAKQARELRKEESGLRWQHRELLLGWKSAEEEAAFWAQQELMEMETDGDEVKAK